MSPANEPPRLVEGRDYTVEDGRWVFTEHFLRQRGYCCKSGCRNCPYGFRKDSGDMKQWHADDANSSADGRG
jgi:hypothetical protein